MVALLWWWKQWAYVERRRRYQQRGARRESCRNKWNQDDEKKGKMNRCVVTQQRRVSRAIKSECTACIQHVASPSPCSSRRITASLRTKERRRKKLPSMIEHKKLRHHGRCPSVLKRRKKQPAPETPLLVAFVFFFLFPFSLVLERKYAKSPKTSGAPSAPQPLFSRRNTSEKKLNSQIYIL